MQKLTRPHVCAGKAGCVMLAALALVACRHDVEPMPPGTSCVPPPDAPTKTYPVNLKLKTNADGDAYLEVLEASQCPDRPTEKGCVRAQKNFQADIKFILVGGKQQDCEGGGADNWRLDHVTIADADKAFGDPVSMNVQCDFGTDPNGRVQSPSFQGITMTVHDDNRSEYTAFYQVTAVNCDDPSEIAVTDPRIDNKGTTR